MWWNLLTGARNVLVKRDGSKKNDNDGFQKNDKRDALKKEEEW